MFDKKLQQERNRKYKLKNRDKILKQKKEHYQQNKEELKRLAKEYRKTHRKQNNESLKKYLKKHPEKNRLYASRRDPIKMKARWTNRFRKDRDTKCSKCGSTKNLHFHHTNYEKMEGFTVCSKCHVKIHKDLSINSDKTKAMVVQV